MTNRMMDNRIKKLQAIEAQQKELEQEVWRNLDKIYKLSPFRGDPDPKRDARYLESFSYWKRCLESK